MQVMVLTTILSLVENICTAWGASGKVEFFELYPVTVNNPDATSHVRRVAKDLGLQVVPGDLPLLASEDFSYL